MADCFSLPNVAELVERLRLCADDKSVHCKGCEFMDTENNLCMNIMINCAADAIEALLAENAKLKAERDDAVSDLKSIAPCQKCKHFGINQMTCDALEQCLYGETSVWEWRGTKGEENGD